MKTYNPEAHRAYYNQVNGFDKTNLQKGYDAAINARFVRGAISLAALNEMNPFESGTRQAHLYFRIIYCYSMWRRNGIDSKVNYIRMLRAAAQLAEMNLENPFYCEQDDAIEQISLDELAEKELIHALKEDIESETFIPAENVQHIFGVLPDEEVEQ